MLKLRAGDDAAMSSLVRMYNDRLYNFTLRIVSQAQAAEDIVQETWLSLYEHRERYEPTWRFSTWLFTIARRKALSELRRRKVRSIVKPLTSRKKGEEEVRLEIAQEMFHSPESEASGAVLSELIDVALSRLSDLHRQIVVLRDIEGLENDEVADVLGWSIKPGAIRKRVFDARAAFREEMIRLGVAPEDS
jgi:RNA polymerase sigma-70 factor (ECF subfamily)